MAIKSILDYNKASTANKNTFLNKSNAYVYQTPKPQLIQNNSGGNTNQNVPSSATTNQPYQMLQQQQNNGNDQINADYDQAMMMLGNAETGLRSQAANAGSVIDTSAQDTESQIKNNLGVAESGIQGQVQQAQTSANTASMQARDLFRQTQQVNNAQLSALGISSSSVAEALAERLGVETARRIAGVTDNLSQIQQNARAELGRVKTYYEEKVTTLKQTVQSQKAQIQSQLVSGLNEINASRNQAAAAKSQARANLLSQVQSQMYQLTAQQQQFEQQLQQWAAQKTAALTPVVSDPNYLNTLAQGFQSFSQQFNPSQFNTSMTVGQSGKPSYQVTGITGKQPKEGDIRTDETGNQQYFSGGQWVTI